MARRRPKRMKVTGRAIPLLLAMSSVVTLAITWLGVREATADSQTAILALLPNLAVWACGLVAVTFLVVGARHRPFGAIWHGALVHWTVTAGVIDHIAFARAGPLSGLTYGADVGLNSVMPVLVAVHWLILAPKAGLVLRDVLFWIAGPLVCFAVALGRGALTGDYGYPFLDVTGLGLVAVAINVVLIGLALGGGGLVLIGLARFRPSPQVRPSSSRR